MGKKKSSGTPELRKVIIGGKEKEVFVQVYRAAKVPESPPLAIPRYMNGFRDSTVGLGGNYPMSFASAVLHELGPNWFEFGGGGVK